MVMIEVARLNTDTPRSPGSISTSESSRQNSLMLAHLAQNSEPATSDSSFHLTRKRAASIDTSSANYPQIGDLALRSTSSNEPPTSDLTREQVCLCQPDPKIPRPRNAFILYRQYYQAQVVAQHPGLANPEISKIIGEQWREQAPEEKNLWKERAEQEKQRHQIQYPGYRYQPRRAAKPNGLRPTSSSSADDPVRCPKCSGRYILTPSTPLTPFTPFPSAFGAPTPRNEKTFPSFAPMSSSRITELDRPMYSSGLQSARMDTPRATPLQNHRRSPYPQSLHSHRESNEDADLVSPSPDLKRRRFANETQRTYNGQASQISYSAPQQFARNGVPIAANGFRQQLPGPLNRPGPMGPPQNSPMIQQQRQYTPRQTSGFDESLRLPPLHIPNTPSQRPDLRNDSKESQARSIEAMVMTIPYINKVKVLSKISPPLAPPAPTSPAQEIRGAVIAIEGADLDLVAEIGAFIREHISKDPTCAVQIWTMDPAPKEIAAVDTVMTEGLPADVSVANAPQDPFVKYLSTISSWHVKSREITKFITTAPSSTSTDSTTPSQKILPVALLPKGFSLTTSDQYSLCIPINDSYAPVDHWQWMATLWRGIIGPDLTVFVKRVGDQEEMERMGGVEMRSDCSVIVVRVPEESKMDEKTARRLGFEVLEIVRTVESGFGRK